MTPDANSEFVFNLDGATTPQTSAVWPEPTHISELWRAYQERVNPLTKILHVPTVDPLLKRAIHSPTHVPKNVEALLYSIFLMATVSMTPDECLDKLGPYDMTSLQALVIYLVSLQGRSNHHSAWIMNGLAIRIAQKMGLHRDGQSLGLTPFDSEMRRRLWWQIVMLDSKYAVFSGLSQPAIVHNCNTKPPTNIRDEDMDPQATETFQDRDGPTDMIFTLLTHKFAKFFMENPGFDALVWMSSDSGDYGPTKEQKLEYRALVEILRKDLVAVMNKYSDPTAGAVHAMAHRMRQLIDDKLQELLVDPDAQPGLQGEVKNESDNTFRIAITSLEHDAANYMVASDRGFFLWFAVVHFQFDLVIYAAGQLCVRTEGNLVERAWAQLELAYELHPELYDTDSKRCRNLGRYVLKAWRKREAILQSRGQTPVVPGFIEKLYPRILDYDIKTEPTPPDPSSEMYSPPENLAAMTGFGGLLISPLPHDLRPFRPETSGLGHGAPQVAQCALNMAQQPSHLQGAAQQLTHAAPHTHTPQMNHRALQLSATTPRHPQQPPAYVNGTPHSAADTLSPLSNGMVIDDPPGALDFLNHDFFATPFPNVAAQHTTDDVHGGGGQALTDDFARLFGNTMDEGMYQMWPHG
ncbi:hypothetical protein N0V88_007446 [Collariella sp. IMI 366227]|nr:hypothetical protein N0V88_007446 [Collariella sp. IMI 366227]